MLKPRVIPILLLQNDGLVKTTKFKDPRYVGDPINAIKIFNDKEVDELVFLDILASKGKKSIDYELISNIASECFMPLCYGGGIKDIESIRKILQLGVEKIAINSYAFENPNLIKEAALLFGTSTIVISIDVKKNLFGKYEIWTNGGTKKIKTGLNEAVLEMEQLGAGEILINSIDKDGTMLGYDCKLIEQVSKLVSIPVVAAGGAGKISDFTTAINSGASAVAAGSMFVFHGKHKAVLITYPSRKEIW
ncbi:AglZ/HisF2 family acetamidino modification protein [Flavobacterium sp. B183]|uniref:AglZ/HisF2 family acetamidino modification protein n=1 Tax=Flavobacterium TaxID=237 RepID=UPI002111D7F5|nr:AglZ/HisF2 family acetamidino modification protein [Flavobacterium sp. B183]